MMPQKANELAGMGDVERTKIADVFLLLPRSRKEQVERCKYSAGLPTGAPKSIAVCAAKDLP